MNSPSEMYLQKVRDFMCLYLSLDWSHYKHFDESLQEIAPFRLGSPAIAPAGSLPLGR